MKCPNCGKEAKPGMSFCMECGTKLVWPDEPVQQPTPPVKQPTQPSGGENKKTLIIIAAIAAIAIVVAVILKFTVLNGGNKKTDKDIDISSAGQTQDDSDYEDEPETETESEIETESEYVLTAADLLPEAIELYTIQDVMAKTGPDDASDDYVQLDVGTMVEAVDYDGIWSYVIIGDEICYVRSEYLAEEVPYEVLRGENGSINLDEIDYIFPDSDTVPLTEEDVEGMTAQEAQLARNEIFARHGRKFDTDWIREYFESKDWYEGTIDSKAFDYYNLNVIERENCDVITAYEKKMGYR